jgi:hypothetical protein
MTDYIVAESADSEKPKIYFTCSGKFENQLILSYQTSESLFISFVIF